MSKRQPIELPKETISNHLSKDTIDCILCNCEATITTGPIGSDETITEVYQTCYCSKCFAKWRRVYRIDDIDNVEIIK